MTRTEFRKYKKKYCPNHHCMLCRHQEQCYEDLGYDGATLDEIFVVAIIILLTLFCGYCVCSGFYILG